MAMSDYDETIRVRVDGEVKTFTDHESHWTTEDGLVGIRNGDRMYFYPVQNIVEIVKVVDTD